MAYDTAIARVASEIERIQAQYGRQAFACLSGASLTIEKAYLMGKFARVCLKTPYIDYNGRLCMVSAGAANKKAFGIDRAANPWSDILNAKVVWISGANIAECAPRGASGVKAAATRRLPDKPMAILSAPRWRVNQPSPPSFPATSHL